VSARREDGTRISFRVTVRIDTPQEVLYYQHGGILPYVLRQLLWGRQKAPAIGAGPATAPAARPNAKKVDEGSRESFPASDPPAY
jgi:aconitate hydratase